MGSKRISVTGLFLMLILAGCTGDKGRPSSGFEGPGPLSIAPNIIKGEGELLYSGGIISHYIYGIDLTNFYPFDINGSNEGNKIDNSIGVDSIALTLDGRFLFGGGVNTITVYDMLAPETPFVLPVDGWVTSFVGDPEDARVCYASLWNGVDGFLYKLNVNITQDESSFQVIPEVIKFEGMLPLKVLLNLSSIRSVDPMIYILFKVPAVIAGIDYFNPAAGIKKSILLSESPRLADMTEDSNFFYVVSENAELHKFSRVDGTEAIQAESQGTGALPLAMDSVPMDMVLLRGEDGATEYIAIVDGKGYIDLFDSKTACPFVNTSYVYKGFTDMGESSNPVLEDIQLSSCNTKSEDWTITYLGKIFDTDMTGGIVFNGDDIFVDYNVDFISTGINLGDRVVISGNEFAGEYLIVEIVDTNTLRLERKFSQDLSGITYNIKGFPYLVKGSVSGIQKRRANENEAYISDKGEIGFTITSKENPVTEGDTFYLTTAVDRIELGGLPYGVAVDSSGFLYISNFGYNSISVVNPAELKVIDTLR